jgi:transposase
VVVIWVQRFEETGSVAAKPSGGSTSPLEKHAEFLLALIADKPDLTLDEIVVAMRKRRIAGSRSAVWRLFARRNISFKKNSVRGGAEAGGRGPSPPPLEARARHV